MIVMMKKVFMVLFLLIWFIPIILSVYIFSIKSPDKIVTTATDFIDSGDKYPNKYFRFVKTREAPVRDASTQPLSFGDEAL